jgi:hypothetical protein
MPLKKKRKDGKSTSHNPVLAIFGNNWTIFVSLLQNTTFGYFVAELDFNPNFYK